jgi:hypothetical protein
MIGFSKKIKKQQADLLVFFSQIGAGIPFLTISSLLFLILVLTYNLLQTFYEKTMEQ